MSGRRGRAFIVWLVLIGVVGAAAQSYVFFRERWLDGMEAILLKHPDLGGNGGATAYLPIQAFTNASTVFHPDVNFAHPDFGITGPTLELTETASATLPAPPPGSPIEVSGVMPADGATSARVRVTVGEQSALSEPLPPGEFNVKLPTVASSTPPSLVTVRVEVGTAGEGQAFQPLAPPLARKVILRELYFRAPASVAHPGRYISAAEARASARFGKRLRWTADLTTPALVQLPLLYYPGMIEITDQGRPISYGNVGQRVAVRLDAGRHNIRAQFVGIGWANMTSGAGWVGVAGLAVWAGARRMRRTAPLLRTHPHSPDPAGALIAAAVFGLVLMAPEIVRRARHATANGPTFTVTASRYLANEARAARAAFDGDPTTAWAVNGSAPVTLTIRPERPARLSRVYLHARWQMFVEQWHRVAFNFYQGEKLVRTYEASFPDAHVQPVLKIALPRVEADRIEMHFTEPVTQLRDQSEKLDLRNVEPGYSDIGLVWE